MEPSVGPIMPAMRPSRPVWFSNAFCWSKPKKAAREGHPPRAEDVGIEREIAFWGADGKGLAGGGRRMFRLSNVWPDGAIALNTKIPAGNRPSRHLRGGPRAHDHVASNIENDLCDD